MSDFVVLPPGANLDAESVSAVVCKYALGLGCTPSNATASVAWAIRNGFDTLSAIRAGKMRATQLRARELAAAVRGVPA